MAGSSTRDASETYPPATSGKATESASIASTTSARPIPSGGNTTPCGPRTPAMTISAAAANGVHALSADLRLRARSCPSNPAVRRASVRVDVGLREVWRTIAEGTAVGASHGALHDPFIHDYPGSQTLDAEILNVSRRDGRSGRRLGARRAVGGRGAGTPPHELADPALELGAGHQYLPVAAEAAESDVGAEAHDFPLVAAAGMRLARADHIAEHQLEDRHGSFSGPARPARPSGRNRR